MARTKDGKRTKLAPMNKVAYDLCLWMLSVLLDLFFREVHPRGAWKIPRKGPVLFVAAPHANQFVDPLMLMRMVRTEAHRRIAFLIAAKSMKRRVVGTLAAMAGAVPVGRAMDLKRAGEGKIYLPDPENEPNLLRGVGTKFDFKDFQVGGLIVLPSVNNDSASAEIAEIIGPEELRLKKPFKGPVAIGQLTGRKVSEDGSFTDGSRGATESFEGTKFSIAPKVDQTEVYDSVFEKLNQGGCVGIFPEGGSHDRTELLPLKPGVAIMALGALAANPDCGVTIVPCGMNYFHAHKFRSRAVIEFGDPVEIPPELVELYKQGERREAVGHLLETVYEALVAVTVTAPDYNTLMLIQAVRRLYNTKGKKLPLPMIIELNRRLTKGYERYKDDERVKNLMKDVLSYNKELLALNLRDHQVDYAKFSYIKAILILFYRLGKILLLAIAVLPGLILFSPVFIAGKLISIQKSKEALAASSVKINANDVVATWKLLVAMALAPALLITYTIAGTWWAVRNRIQGYLPESVPIFMIPIISIVLLPTITYAALRFGEIGMDIVKSLRPLLVSLSPTSGNSLTKLRERRTKLAGAVTDLINTLGPEMFPDFDAARIVADPLRDDTSPLRLHRRNTSDSLTTESLDSGSTSPISPDKERRTSIGMGVPSRQSHLPRNESFKNLGNIGLFATRPTTPHRSRSRTSSAGGSAGSAGFSLQGFSSLDTSAGFDEVSQKIRGAMRERGQRRRSGADGFELTSGATTPGSEDGKKNI
ncbi:hypothetical protein EJ05DRAFT_479920 [Pseudovirgaria hyperparasitica]|uniref:Phospholipid/glycerol acyltransferase domain-containing protein n=1 Tax=Pseudovirgaria hyperparasitica TaxID=470096 RepID=A0A6A6VXA8_9PEZI|nr:uncharacterized protein EJ05DRAFT_479920 [Pseudovirgaria hyperparasitica]KAF2753897.1 hypothetical protein EJ05DRAFT_479920 [Pseudovirgaria hyperparasitica]